MEMIHSVERTPPVSPATPDAQSEPGEVAHQGQGVPAEGLHKPEPIALDVQRGEDGVFVYTLSDPSTGRLVAVIPDTAQARTAGNYASGGWVSLTA